MPVAGDRRSGASTRATHHLHTDTRMLTQDQRNDLEKRLLREREELVASMQEFDRREGDFREQSGEISVYRFHMADIGTETMEREKEFLFASRDGRRLWEIDEALRRLYREPDTFGTCERCGAPVTIERLDVIPAARFCKDCQQALETAGSEPPG